MYSILHWLVVIFIGVNYILPNKILDLTTERAISTDMGSTLELTTDTPNSTTTVDSCLHINITDCKYRNCFILLPKNICSLFSYLRI